MKQYFPTKFPQDHVMAIEMVGKQVPIELFKNIFSFLTSPKDIVYFISSTKPTYQYYNFLSHLELKKSIKNPSSLIKEKIKEYITKINSNKIIESTLLSMLKKIREEKPDIFINFIFRVILNS